MAHYTAISLASDGTNVYATTYGTATTSSIVSIPVSGGAATTLASSSYVPYFVPCVAVDDESVYWTTPVDGVVKIAKAGGMPVTLAPAFSSPSSTAAPIALDATNVYWSQTEAVTRVSKAGGTPVTLLSASFYPSSCHCLAVSNASLFVADFFVMGADGGEEVQMLSLPTTGGVPPPQTALVTVGDPSLVAATSTGVFWLGEPPITVNETPLDGGTTTTLAAPLANNVSDLVVASDGTVYWLTNDQVQSMKP
jgi:hypothetical protein